MSRRPKDYASLERKGGRLTATRMDPCPSALGRVSPCREWVEGGIYEVIGSDDTGRALGRCLHGGGVGGLKIGFVDSQRVSAEAPQAEGARRALYSEFAPRNRQIEKMQRSIEALQDRLMRNQAVMSDGQAQKLREEPFNKESDFLQARRDFQDDPNMRRNEELSTLQRVCD